MGKKSHLDMAIGSLDGEIDALEGQLAILYAAKVRLVAQRDAQKLRQDAAKATR